MKRKLLDKDVATAMEGARRFLESMGLKDHHGTIYTLLDEAAQLLQNTRNTDPDLDGTVFLQNASSDAMKASEQAPPEGKKRAAEQWVAATALEREWNRLYPKLPGHAVIAADPVQSSRKKKTDIMLP